MADPYETLGVKRDASQDDIRKAYRKAAKESHPDLHPGKPEAETRFKDINAANDILSDPDKRKRYDAGEIDASGAERAPERHYYREYAEADPNMRYRRPGAGSAGSNRGFAGRDPDYGADSPGFDADYDIFADLFRGRGAGSGGAGHFSMPPQDVRYALEIPFLEAVNGTKKTVTMPDGKTLDITIPAGIADGQVLRLKGQGLPGSDGKTGNAHIEISVAPHASFTRDGNDILSTLPVSLGEALNGASVRADTVDGPVDVRIPKGARQGAKLRLRGKGVPRGKPKSPAETADRGDHLIELDIVPPEGADDALAAYVAEWEKTHPQNPRRKAGA